MKTKLRNLLIGWLFTQPIRKYAKKTKDEFFVLYLLELLGKHESEMLGSRDGLNGYLDLDIEMNRQLQKELKEYAGN